MHKYSLLTIALQLCLMVRTPLFGEAPNDTWGNCLSDLTEAEGAIHNKLEKLFGEETYRGKVSPKSILIQGSIERCYSKISPEATPRIPGKTWEQDLANYKGLVKEVSKFFKSDTDYLTKWLPSGLGELWIVDGNPDLLVFSMVMSNKEWEGNDWDPPRDSVLMLFAEKKGKNNWIISALTRPAEYGVSCIHDLADLDEDGREEIIIQWRGYEDHGFTVYSRANGLRIIYSHSWWC